MLPLNKILQRAAEAAKREYVFPQSHDMWKEFAQPSMYRMYTAVVESEDQVTYERTPQTVREVLGYTQMDEAFEGPAPFPEGNLPRDTGYNVMAQHFANRFLPKDASGAQRPFTETEMEPTFAFLETILTYLMQMGKCRDFEDFFHATAQMIRSITGRSLLKGFQVIWNRVKDLIQDVVNDIYDTLQGEEPPSFENPFSIFRNWITKIDEVKTHPIVQKCRKIFLYILSYSFMERFGITFDTFWFTKAEADFHREKHSDDFGFFYSIIEGASYIMERLYDCYKTGTWSALTHSTTSYGKWADAVYAIKADTAKLQNPEANGLSYHEFLSRLDNTIEKGTAICKFMVADDPKAKLVARKLLSELEMIKATECTKKAARQSRDSPFAILWFAGSGIGKSSLTTLTFQHFGKIHDLPTDDEFHYTRTFSDPFYSGFASSAWSVNLDDIASKNPDLGEDPSMADVLQIINNVPFTPPQAELADKGKTPMRAALVQATTNTKNLNATAYYCNTLAIQRRFPMVVTATVKAEYAIMEDGVTPDANCRMLDSSRTPPLEDGEYPNYWDFEIQYVKANVTNTGTQYATFVPAGLHHTSCIHEFLRFVGTLSHKHKSNQAIMRASAKKYAAVEVCKQCYTVVSRCKCEELQSEEAVRAAALFIGGGAALLGVSKLGSLVRRRAHDEVVNFTGDVLATIAQRIREPPVEMPTEEISPSQDDEDFLTKLRRSLNVASLSVSERLEVERIKIRSILSTAGQTTRQHVIKHPAMMTFLLAIPTILMGIKMYSMYKLMSVQSIDAKDPRDFRMDEKPNPWYRETYTPSSWELGPLTKSWKAISEEHVLERVTRNTMFVEARYINANGDHVVRSFRMLCLAGQLYVTSNHNLPAQEMELTVIPSVVTAGVGDKFSTLIFERDLYRDYDADMVYFVVGCTPPRSDVSGLLCDKTFQTKCRGNMVTRDKLGESQNFTLKALVPSREPTAEIGDKDCFRGECSVITEAGHCGSPYVGFTPVGPVLLGLHIMGGRTNSVAASRLTREAFELAKAKLNYMVVVAGTPNLCDIEGNPIPIDPIHPKSTFRYIEKGTANVRGSFAGFRAANKSKVAKTLIHQAMADGGYKADVGAPVMKGYGPWRHAHLDIVQQSFVIEQSRLKDCVAAFVHDITTKLTPDDFAEMKILDDVATVNGLPGVKYIDKMNRNTSMGFPWRHGKRQELHMLGPFDIWQDAVEFKSEFYERVEKLIANYKAGVRNMPVYIEHLKDEVLPMKKIIDEKTRVFAACPADFAFVMRKYLLSTVRVIQKNKFIFECAPGTNATSLEWEEIYHYLIKFGKDRMVAGDYSKFDKRMGALMILAAFDVIYGVLKAAGWTSENLMVIVTMAFDVAFPLVDANGDIVEFWGSNPSGHPLTVIINSIVNSLYVRYAWSLVGNDLALFQEFISLMTYGDDNTFGVSEKIANFDHTVLQKQLATIGVVYTMADKEAQTVPFIHIDDISFLKRKWVWSEDVGAHVAQLEHASIVKSLMYHIPSTEVSCEFQAVEVMGNALREYFFYGREKYEERKQFFEATIESLDLTEYATGFMHYDECVEQYLDNNKCFTSDGRCAICSC